MVIKIMGKFEGTTEELDTADNDNSAKYLLAEYRMAFGPGWQIWQENDNDTET